MASGKRDFNSGTAGAQTRAWQSNYAYGSVHTSSPRLEPMPSQEKQVTLIHLETISLTVRVPSITSGGQIFS